MRAVHFGAGNIGRGFIGQLLHESGYEITFVDVSTDLIETLKSQRRYDVIAADENERRVSVGPVFALHSELEAGKVLAGLAEADLITTAVGPSILPLLAPAIAEGLLERDPGAGPVNVIACENMVGGSQALRASVMEHVPAGAVTAIEEGVGFPNAAVDRIVPEQETKSLDVLVEPFFEWIVDASQVKGERPDIRGLTYVEDPFPYIERKLLTVNTGHSAAAYLGYLHGRRTISEALADERIREVVSGSLEETGMLLCGEYGFDPSEHGEYRRKVLDRFLNPRISDEVSRVARGPIRKLGRDERLVSPALRLLAMGEEPGYLARVIAAVLRYDHAEDPEALELQETIRSEGERAVLARYAGVGEDHRLVDLVERQTYTARRG